MGTPSYLRYLFYSSYLTVGCCPVDSLPGGNQSPTFRRGDKTREEALNGI